MVLLIRRILLIPPGIMFPVSRVVVHVVEPVVEPGEGFILMPALTVLKQRRGGWGVQQPPLPP